MVALSLFSQNAKIDSLQQKLNLAKGNERILVLNDLANEYGYVDFNKSISLAQEALRLSGIQKYNYSEARSYNIIGRAYYISNNFKVADAYYTKGILLAKKYNTPDDIYKALRLKTLLYVNGYITNPIVTKAVFKQYINMTVAKKQYTDFIEALKLYAYIYNSKPQEVLEITNYLNELKIQMKGDSEFLSVISASEGFIFKQNLEYFRAIEKFKNAIKLTKDISAEISYLERIGMIYFEIRKYKESVRYFKDALQLINIRKPGKEEFILHLLEADLGASSLQLKDYNVALSYLQKALKNPYFSNRDLGAISGNMGVAYMSINNFGKADFYLSKAISIFDKLTVNSDKLAYLNSKAELIERKKQWNQLPVVINDISTLVDDVKEYYIVYDSYKLLSDYYEKSGDYKKSNKYLKKWITANDSINNRELVTKMKEFEFKYETEKKEQQIALQQDIIKNKNQLLVFSVISGSLILAALLVIFILYRIRNKAYKQLVYQSLGNTSYAEPVEIEDSTDDENAIEIKNGTSSVDDGLKNQIEIALNKQLDAKVYLESNLILKTLAEKCDTNRSYLSQFINEQYNMNFNTFINTLRINEAKKILSDINNNIPLKELYLQLGFNTYSVFNEAFKKHVGVTPAFFLKTVKDLYSVSNPNKIQ